ncbi:MAG TPA: RsmE family RNA methyltransferase [Candidatus Krumholzibacteria bacterium]|nr:RsmE family RNA methyltransferase [Candidatus Krumholzibacteria bacterium]HPD71098.1 RsmE family RNA methyltransferase [Candidatus Krumholzibacteria bacterium]HRY39202.1 RsmE family RNA methyltransferase [Candidatus Krumholzibacteria bacterium]
MVSGRRFYVELGGASPRVGQSIALAGDESHHLRTVLRAAGGEVLDLTDGRGHALRGVLRGGGRREALVEITEVSFAAAEIAAPRLHLVCAIVKGKRFELALEKAVELGAHSITPLSAARGVVDPRDGKLDRWRGVLIGALKQSGRCHLPDLNAPATLDEALAGASGPVYFGAAPGDAAAGEPQQPAAAAAQAARRRAAGEPPPPALWLLIGPEGGWTDGELSLLAARLALPLVLGPHVLRTETAAVAGLAGLQQVRAAWLA